jgi:hypothetical protein
VPNSRGLFGTRSQCGAKKRVQLDRILLAPLMGRWHPEMHTFHLSCGKNGPGAVDVLETWRTELQARFAYLHTVSNKIFVMYLI